MEGRLLKADPGQLVLSMLESWSISTSDSRALTSHFAEDATYQPLPGLAPIVGQRAIGLFTGRLLGAFDRIVIDVVCQTVQGSVVMNERRDILQRRGRHFEVPAMGVFEVQDGLIRAWRDYSDLGTVLDGINARRTNFDAASSHRPWQWRRR